MLLEGNELVEVLKEWAEGVHRNPRLDDSCANLDVPSLIRIASHGRTTPADRYVQHDVDSLMILHLAI